MRRAGAGLAVAAVLAVAGCGGSTAPGAAGGTASSAAGPATSTGSAPGQDQVAAIQGRYEAVIGEVLPSVVEISTSNALGSGVVFDAGGDIVTNAHVVGSATRFSVRVPNSATTLTATLVGTFPAGDLAVIKVSGARDLHPARFANSDDVRIGELVLAMGNPLGLSSSVTDGIVSAVGRTLSEPRTADSPGATLPDSIQTSAAINPGNSGGALVDLFGQVIGIPTLAATDQQLGGAAPGIGFAIPSNIVTSIARQLIASGKVTHSGRAALGVEVTGVVDAQGAPAGAGVVAVRQGGAAAAAGMKPGDVIVAVDGKTIGDPQDLSAVLAGLQVGQTATVTVVRDGDRKQLSVKLGELP